MIKVKILICLIACVSQEVLADDSSPALTLSTTQGVHYSSLPQIESSALHYDGGLNLGLRFPLGLSGLYLAGQAGIHVVAPPPAGDLFSVRGFWGFRNSLLLSYRIGGMRLGAAGGFQVYRFWNTKIMFATPEISLFASVYLNPRDRGDAPMTVEIRPRVYSHFRPDTGFSGGALLELVFVRPLR